MMSRALVIIAFLLLAGRAPAPARAQTWGGARVEDLIARAVERRSALFADSGLQDYTARAHGFVLFLAQFGEGFNDPPRLVRADQLALEVYWKAPGASKQRIIGRRDRVDLPTDIEYHRDHLGIVQNDFGDRIRLGDGHEVRDVLHPLAPTAGAAYEYALADSLTIRLPQRDVRVHEVMIRPRNPATAAVVGSLFLDDDAAEVVRFRFTFTRSAYRDATVEDITVVLDNGLWNARYWLPRRQEIEIRRRTAWLDLPARGIIRGRWEIGDYEFNVGLGDRLFLGPEIVQAPANARATYDWSGSIDQALRVEDARLDAVDLDAVRRAMERVASRRALSGLAQARAGASAVSDFLHFNRVQGLAPGFGAVWRPHGGAAEIRGWLGYGVSDHRLAARLRIAARLPGRRAIALEAARDIRDLADEPVVSPLLNSFSAQELGHDFGDYFLVERVSARLHQLGGPLDVTVGVKLERISGVVLRASPASGSFRPNPDLGDGDFLVGTLALTRSGSDFAPQGELTGRLSMEAGAGEGRGFFRLSARGRFALALGPTRLISTAWAGVGTAELPRHRAFAIGGRGTLPGEAFRAWGGRAAALSRVQWEFPVPVPQLRLGSFVTTGRQMTVAPFLAAGWAWRPLPQTPWVGSAGARPVAGVGLGWLHGLVRLDLGVGLRGGNLQAVMDIRRELWGIL